jgi:hypothetical protein
LFAIVESKVIDDDADEPQQKKRNDVFFVKSREFLRDNHYNEQKNSAYREESHDGKINGAKLFQSDFNEGEGERPEDDWEEDNKRKIFLCKRVYCVLWCCHRLGRTKETSYLKSFGCTNARTHQCSW